MTMWMVRAGRNASAIDEFLEEGRVAIGFGGAALLPLGASKEEVVARVEAVMPGKRDGQRRSAAGQVWRFLSELEYGDQIVTWDPGARRFLVGELVEGDGQLEESGGRFRNVKWTHHVLKDVLSADTRNKLGSIMTLFRVRDSATSEIVARMTRLEEDLDTASATPESPSADVDATDDSQGVDNILDRAAELIEDRIAGLGWEELQDLVAGVLRAMGYRTYVSPRGADRGVDIIASPDGLGLEDPRIFVEVKHRLGTTMGAPALRSFLGGRQPGDKCLYVSTGGFTKEARYEAERSSIPITLVDLPRLRSLLVDHYASADEETRAMMPLQAVHWPV